MPSLDQRRQHVMVFSRAIAATQKALFGVGRGGGRVVYSYIA